MKTGDVVQLKSGGPKMTVQRLVGEHTSKSDAFVDNTLKTQKGVNDGDPICQWFSGEEVKSDVFKANMVKIIAEE